MSVEQVVIANDSILGEICEKLNILNHDDIRAVNMVKKTVTRDMLLIGLKLFAVY